MRRPYPREAKGLAPGQTEGQGTKPGLELDLLVQASFQHGGAPAGTLYRLTLLQ